MFKLWSHITSPLYAQGTPGVQAGALLLSLSDIELSTREKGLSQNALSHMWYQEISEYLIKSGRTDATPEWVKRNLKKTYLGCEEVTYTDFITGAKETTWEPRHTSQLDTGEMHIFLCKVEAWCAQFGLALTIPNGCEYQQLRDKQEA